MKFKYNFNFKSALLTTAGVFLVRGLAKKVFNKDSKTEEVQRIHYEMDSGPIVPYEDRDGISYQPYEPNEF